MNNYDSSYSYSPNNFIDYRKKIKFNPICIDSFFKNPNFIRDWALKLPKQNQLDGDWPGLRTEPLHLIDKNLNNTLLLKILSAYFDLRYENISWQKSNVTFQLTKPYSSDKNNVKNKGWIHQDNGTHLAGLIYLTPNADLDSGTSLFNLKKEYENNFLYFASEPEKQSLYIDLNFNEEIYKKSYEERSKKFYEKINFSNIFNRLIMYDGNEFHRANNLHTGQEERLTLVFFIEGISNDFLPIDRINNFENFDNNIENKIKSIYENTKSEKKLPEQTNVSDK